MGSSPKAPAPPPPPPKPVALPDPDSQTAKTQGQKEAAQRRAKSGRVSTILSDKESLG